MAIDAADLPLLFGEAARRPFAGAVLTLGRQDVTVTPRQLDRLARLCGAAPPELPAGSAAPDTPLDDAALLRALGFASVDSMDVSGYEGATILHDLNESAPPPELEGRFDVVFDRGTAEHVFHLPNLLASLVRMTKPGGRLMHLVPSSNHMDHGFYMFSPTLFHDYYRANGLAVEQIRLVRHPFLQRDPVIEIYDYRPGALTRIAHGGLDDGSYQIFCVATRLEDARWDQVPQQSFYVEAWQDGTAGGGTGRRGGGLKAAVRSALRAVPPVQRAVSALASRLKKRRYMRQALPPIARYRIEG